METEETKVCKYCTSQIPKKAKVCPVCKKKQKGKARLIIIAAVILLVIIIAASGGGDDEAKINNDPVQTDTSPVEDTAEKDSSNENVVLPGGSFEANDLKVTVTDAVVDYKLKDNAYGFYDLDSGMVYVAVSFTFENTGSSDKYVSIYDFDCYADNTLCEQQYVSDGGDFINANLSAGRNTSFTTFYAVPADAEVIELEYTANIWTDAKVIVKVK